MMRVLTFDQYCLEQGVPIFPPSFPELHRTPGGLPGSQKRKAEKRVASALTAWCEKRDELRAQYNAMSAAGEIREPGTGETLRETAQGTGVVANAARRVLAKRKWRQP